MAITVNEDTTILGQIKAAITGATTPIKSIELADSDEMKAFLNSPEFKVHPNTDKHYAENVVPVPTRIAPVKAEGDVPLSCYYMGVYIYRKP